MTSFDSYALEIKADLKKCIQDLGCQPILFIGSGVSRRYFEAPTWDELLDELIKQCPLIDKPYSYFKQTYKCNLEIAEQLVPLYREWAWSKQTQFPAHLFEPHYSQDIYLKYKVTELLKNKTPSTKEALTEDQKKGRW
ncbi:MAG: hypothetical protein ACKO37_08290 [Vampirovibrionales bacterium]